MCTFQLFQNWNVFRYSQCIRKLKVETEFDQDDHKMDDLARLSFTKETLFKSSDYKHPVNRNRTEYLKFGISASRYIPTLHYPRLRVHVSCMY